MDDYLNLTNLIRLLVLASFAYWVLIDIPRWWRKRRAAKASLPPKAKAPKPPKVAASVANTLAARAGHVGAPATADEQAAAPVPARRRTLGTIAAAHGVAESSPPPAA